MSARDRTQTPQLEQSHRSSSTTTTPAMTCDLTDHSAAMSPTWSLRPPVGHDGAGRRVELEVDGSQRPQCPQAEVARPSASARDGNQATQLVDWVRADDEWVAAESDTAQLAQMLLDENEGLRARLETLPVIEQAKGMLIARYHVDADTAFLMLRNWSSHTNIKLRHICRLLVTAGARPAGDQSGNGVRVSPGPTFEEVLQWLQEGRCQVH